MSHFLQNPKHKIDLADYNYITDVKTRLFLATLTSFEIEVLKEIANGSLKTSIDSLAETLEIDKKELIPVLEKLSHSRLFTCHYHTLVVDKAKRKYFETHLIKFQDDFEPNIEFLQNILNNIPLHLLLHWYAIPKTADHIFQSIIEKYLLTPKIYERYLSELTFDDSTLHAICQEVFTASDFLVKGKFLREKFQLSHEQFEKNILILEYNLVCFLSYQLVNGMWEEVVTPFSEWRDYLRFRHETDPKTLKSGDISPCYVEVDFHSSLHFNDRDVREVERSLKRVVGRGWIYYEEFLNGLTVDIGNTEGISLKNKGRRWKYVIPSYSEQELAFIQTTLLGHLSKAGFVSVGTYEGRICFSVTPFGRQALE